jgi:hypothetical protein
VRRTRCLAVPLAVFVLLAASVATAAAASPSGVLSTQLRPRTASSPYDQYFQITNTTSAPADLSGC